ncbi:MAG TPA: hypothetical protein VF546_20755 [Pyrinomonadaceae bacterium]|jgi:predicted  nucleic acid-binding Zn-ribbon protein
MSEDPTKDLPLRPFEERVLAEFAAMRQEFAQLNKRLDSLDGRLSSVEGRLTSVEGRLTSLEEKVDARLRETRPIWEGVLERLTKIEEAMYQLNRQIKSLILDMFQMRVRVEKLEDERTGA